MDSLAKYSFLPWLRQGIATKIAEKDKLGVAPSGNMAKERPELEVNLKMNAYEIRKRIKIHGPGDVAGINRDAIIRVHPKPGTKDFESNALAYIEFYEEDFPWRYTPALHATDEKRLRPWLALVVAKEGEYEFNQDTGGLPVLSVKSQYAPRVFPDHKEIWAWAHVHINHSLSDTNLSNTLEYEIDNNPDVAYSRILCPRRLEKASGEDERIRYHAFLVPAFETGRLAGLGEDPADVYAQQSSWKANGAPATNTRPYDFPVYYHWEFETGPYGDFETLVSILKAQPLGDRFGKRDMSIQKPGMGLDGVADSDTLGLEGALIPPGFTRDAWPNGSGDGNFRDQLRKILNASQDLQDAATAGSVRNPFFAGTGPQVFYSENMADDPIVTPPVYGRWHAMVNRIPEGGSSRAWIDDLNLDPRNRAAAAVGSRIVMKHQEKYMEMAWRQVGEINEANRKIREAELAKMVNNTYYEKRLSRMSGDKLMMVASPAMKYLRQPGGNTTFEEAFTSSKIPNAAKSAAFKKMIRPGRKNIKRLNKLASAQSNPVKVQSHLLNNFNQEGDTALTAARPKFVPLMALPATTISTTINCFLTLQNDGSVNADPTLALDPETISSQQEYQADFESFATVATSLFQGTPLLPIENLQNFSQKFLGQMNPMVTMNNLLKAIISTGEGIEEEVKPIMAYPEFPEPMFEELQKVSQDFIIPNISEIPENTITLLRNNQVFIEAFMAGLNHEMSKELLWREYPTDQRGSYFRNFWDDKDSLSTDSPHDITPMHTWDQPLGEHNERIMHLDGTIEEKKNFVVLVIRGDLLKKYPNTVVYAQKAVYDNPKTKPRKLSDMNNADNIKTPIFQAELEPDIALFGFSLTVDEARGNLGENRPGWFFVLKERPGQINFGLDDYVDTDPNNNAITIPPSNAPTWNDLSWGHLVPANGNLNNLYYIKCSYVRADATNPDWGTNAAEMAYILYQNPVIFARHAEEMLP